MMMSISKLLTRSRMHGCVCMCVGGGDGGLACREPQDPPRRV